MDEGMIQKVLLVDDRPENIMVLESTLENPLLEFVTADCGEEALRQLLRNDISLILLDVQMPGMDGFETATLIRGNPSTKHIPIIFVSAISKEDKHIFKGYASGAIDYMFKPFDPEIMKSKVNILLELDKNRRLVESQNSELIEAKRNTDGILDNVKEGLFLLDSEGRILSQYSKALEQILGTNNLENIALLELLNGKIPDKTCETCSEFIEICFDEKIDESMIEDLNPLSDIQYRINSDSDGELAVKYLSFECQRIASEESIDRLIFMVTDNTQKVLLEQKLQRLEEESRKQMDSLLGVLHVDPKLLKDFIESLERDIDESKKMLGNLVGSKKRNEILDQMFRNMHLIKGNAAILDLKLFMNEAHKAEEFITLLKEGNEPTEKDLKSLCQCLENIQNGVDDINQLISKLSHIYKNFRPKRSYEIELLFRAVKNLIANLEGSTGKKVELVYNNFDGVAIPYNCRLDLKDILVQLTRNAFHHGIETAEERKKAKKDEVGKITVKTFKGDNLIGFSFHDDGRGIQLSRLRNVAKRSGNWKDNEIDQWDEKQVMDTIFMPGITTATKANTVAGRGIGMDIIKQMVDKLGGKVEVNSEEGKYSEFQITFPLPS